jgi:hypothetical protein
VSKTCHSAVILVALSSVLLLAGFAGAQGFTNSDSIEVHGLVYIGKLDRATYTYIDSVRCQLVVANRSEQPISMNVSVVYDAIFDREAWCDTGSPPEPCTTPAPVIGGWGDIDPFVLSPGEHVVASATFASRRPAGDTWEFWHGSVLFKSPWNAKSPFTFTISYRRERSITIVSAATWTTVRQLYP